MKKTFFTIILLVMFLCSTATFLCAAAFKQGALEGSWRGYWIESVKGADKPRYTLNVKVEVDSNGTISSGNWLSSGGQAGNVTGGTLTISATGYITGSMEYDYSSSSSNGALANTSGYIIEVVHGQMDLNKEIVSLAIKKSDETLGQPPVLSERLATGVFCKYSNDSSLTPSQLNGEWQVVMMASDQGNNYTPYWLNSVINISDIGGNGSWSTSDNRGGLFIDIQKRLDNSGSLGGAFVIQKTQDPTPLNSVYWGGITGQMDFQMNIGSFETAKIEPNVAYEDRPLAAGIIMRVGATGFSTADMAGEWAVFHSQQYANSHLYWLYSELTIDTTGAVTKGSWAADGAAGTYSEGLFSIDTSGNLQGELTTTSGRVFQMGGYLGVTKSYGSAVSISTDNYYADTLFFVRKPNGVSNIPTVMLLLNQ